MNAVLGLDTATPSTTVALLRADGGAVEARDDPPAESRGQHASRLLGLVERVLADARLTWDEVGRIAVGVGPGGFTGLRIGVATARALAQARGLDVVPVSSLEALAAAVPDQPVAAVIDARRGEVFAAAFAAGGAPKPAPAARGTLLAPAAVAPAALGAALAALSPVPLAVGDGAVRFAAELARAGVTVPPADAPAHRLSAVHVCRLGAVGQPADRDTLLPAYLREPDAKPSPT